MLKRTITALGLAVIGLPLIILGGPFYYLLMGTFLVGAAREYVILFRAAKYQPNFPVTVGGATLVTFTRMFFPSYAQPAFAVSIIAAMAYHLIAYERGRDQSAVDFGITVGGIVYHWLDRFVSFGPAKPSRRRLVVHAGDVLRHGLEIPVRTSIGRAYGRHKMAPRLSPKKSWEGYAASVVTATWGGIFFAYAFTTYGNLAGQITLWQGAILGFHPRFASAAGRPRRKHDQTTVRDQRFERHHPRPWRLL